MSKNVILLDKYGNQLAPATTATQAKYSASETVKDKIDELNTRIDELPSGGGLPDEQLVSHYDFTSSTPYYDIIRGRNSSSEKYGTITATEGTGIRLDSVSSGLKTFYGLSWSECYKIEIKLGNLTYTGSDTSGRKTLFCFDRRGYSNEGGGLNWNLASNLWQAYSGAGWQTADSSYTINSLSNTKITIYFGVYIDGSTGVIYKGDNSATARYFYILDESNNIIVGSYQLNDYENLSQVGIGATNSNAFLGAVFEYLKIYRLNNLDTQNS